MASSYLHAGGVRDLHQSGVKLPLSADRRTGCHGVVYGSRDYMEEEIHKQRGCAPISWQLGTLASTRRIPMAFFSIGINKIVHS